jgi:hypothetical protein
MKKYLLAVLMVTPGLALAADVAVPSTTPMTMAKAQAAPPSQPIKDISSVEPKKSGFSMEGFSFGLGAGVLGGINFNLGYRIPYNPDHFWLNRLGFRLDLNTFGPVASTIRGIADDEVNKYIDDNREPDDSIAINEDEGIFAEDVKFNTRFSGTNFGALVDFYPFSYTWGLGGFRLSGGYYFGSVKLGFDASAQNITANWPDGISADFTLPKFDFPMDVMGNTVNVELDNLVVDSPVTPLGSSAVNISYLDASPLLKLNARGPYLGLGWDIGLFYGLKLTFDAGVVFTQPHRLSVGLDIDNPMLGYILINIEEVADQLKNQLKAKANMRIDEICGSTCTQSDRDAALSSVTWDDEVDQAKINLRTKLITQLNDAGLQVGVDYDIVGDNIKVNGNSALKAIGADSVIDDAKGEIYAERDKAIRDFDKEVKDYGYFPMVKLGLIYRF